MVKQIAIGSGVLIFLAFPAAVHAQSLTEYLEGKAYATYRIEVGLPEDTVPGKSGFFRTLWQYLTTRAKQDYRAEVGTKFIVFSNAYASSPYQTDGTPCVTSAGTRVRPGVVASNFLPLGTLLEINGDEYIVEDRMNPRYQGYFIDVWFPSTSKALDWGGKKVEVTVVGYANPGEPIREGQENEELIVGDGASGEGFLQQLQQGFSRASLLLGARRNEAYVNRFDVDCLED